MIEPYIQISENSTFSAIRNQTSDQNVLDKGFVSKFCNHIYIYDDHKKLLLPEQSILRLVKQ